MEGGRKEGMKGGREGGGRGEGGGREGGGRGEGEGEKERLADTEGDGKRMDSYIEFWLIVNL